MRSEKIAEPTLACGRGSGAFARAAREDPFAGTVLLDALAGIIQPLFNLNVHCDGSTPATWRSAEACEERFSEMEVALAQLWQLVVVFCGKEKGRYWVGIVNFWFDCAKKGDVTDVFLVRMQSIGVTSKALGSHLNI
jgi:hypothetical protein